MNKLKAYSQVIENALFGQGNTRIKCGDTSRLTRAYVGLFLALEDIPNDNGCATAHDYDPLSYALGVYYYIKQNKPSSLNWKLFGPDFVSRIEVWGEQVFDKAPEEGAEDDIRKALVRYDMPNQVEINALNSL